MTGTLFQDNASPYLTVVEQGSTPSNPSAGSQKLFVNDSDHLLYFVDSSGTVTPVGGAVSEITDIPTADTTTTNVLAPDGAGGVEWRAESGGGGGGGWTQLATNTLASDATTVSISSISGTYTDRAPRSVGSHRLRGPLTGDTILARWGITTVDGGAHYAEAGYRFGTRSANYEGAGGILRCRLLQRHGHCRHRRRGEHGLHAPDDLPLRRRLPPAVHGGHGLLLRDQLHHPRAHPAGGWQNASDTIDIVTLARATNRPAPHILSAR